MRHSPVSLGLNEIRNLIMSYRCQGVFKKLCLNTYRSLDISVSSTGTLMLMKEHCGACQRRPREIENLYIRKL